MGLEITSTTCIPSLRLYALSFCVMGDVNVVEGSNAFFRGDKVFVD